MTNDEQGRLARIERMLEQQAANSMAQAEQFERLFMLLAAGQGKELDSLKKKSLTWWL